MTVESPENVNAHYLDHVVATAQTHEVETTEDIVTGNGIKLLAKGARIDAGARDRLLLHKLRKPLEDCVQVVGGVVPASFEPVAVALLEKYPLLRAMCASERARPAPESLAALTLSLPMQSLLTVYSQYRQDRLEHTVGVAMLALSLARRLLPGDIDRHRVLATAGLVHDVGELYINPDYLRKATRLSADEWRHIVTHPLVGHRVLREMVGAGKAVAEAVLLHHERLDGFGYPHRVAGEAFALDGQILAAAEWLMALVESGMSPLTRAGMASRLVPGEFSPAVLEAVSVAAREAPDTPVELATAAPLEDALPRIVRLADTLQRLRESRAWIDERIAEAAPRLRVVLQAGLNRILRIQASFSSTGLDAHSPKQLLGELAALRDPQAYVEIMTLIDELEWRMRELEREQYLRTSLLSAQELAIVVDLIDRLKGMRPPATKDGT
jgi:HD-GYP domain-containing protein (c-di-GMP phosphodiesterase class II)